MAGKYWQRGLTEVSGTGQFPVAPGTSTVELLQTGPVETGTTSLLRLIITSRLSVEPAAGSPALSSSWVGRSFARVVAALQDPAANWPGFGDTNNVNILGRTSLIASSLAVNTLSPNGGAIYQTLEEIDLRGMRDFTDYPDTPVLRLGGNWASLDGIGDGLIDAHYAWWVSVSILWGVAG